MYRHDTWRWYVFKQFVKWLKLSDRRPGELSALNGIAGSLTEQVKVIHVVGQTTRSMQKKRMMIHHSIGFDPDHQIFNSASKRFRVAEAELWDAEKAPAEIDVGMPPLMPYGR